ncbi:MAG TPA: zinc ribbon domain-containing protein [Solirubrobacteraceae bacterium]|jgi:putative FmdB family regulatory protein|nr:zinc ribbon domain-containing protein [Solirubrobacteraceae bacterium]
MPIYEYRCKKGHTFDVMQRMSDDPVTKCEVCGTAVQRVLHAPAVHFKGSGFYNTDYGTKKRARETKESSDNAKKETSTTTSSESKSSDNGSGSSSDSKSTKKSEKAAASSSSS